MLFLSEGADTRSAWARVKIEDFKTVGTKRTPGVDNARSGPITRPPWFIPRDAVVRLMDLGTARLLVEDGIEIDALPTTYNFKVAPCDPHHDMRRQALGAAHLVRGPVRLIHHKNLKHPHTLCRLVNAAAPAPRVVVGATACAMHDLNQISVHELRDGSPWLAED